MVFLPLQCDFFCNFFDCLGFFSSIIVVVFCASIELSFHKQKLCVASCLCRAYLFSWFSVEISDLEYHSLSWLKLQKRWLLVKLQQCYQKCQCDLSVLASLSLTPSRLLCRLPMVAQQLISVFCSSISPLLVRCQCPRLAIVHCPATLQVFEVQVHEFCGVNSLTKRGCGLEWGKLSCFSHSLSINSKNIERTKISIR